MPEHIQKRDGRLETWAVDRIAKAIFKSLKASGIRDPLLAKRLALHVEEHLADTQVPEQEDVQDMVEQVLMEARLYSVARKYILYREKRRGIRTQDQAFLDVRDTIDTYVKSGDSTGLAPARPHSFQGLSRHLSASVQKRYALEQYPEEIRMAHEHGYLHIHDLSSGMTGHAAYWDLRSLLGKGFGFKGVTAHGPAEHLDEALGQIIACTGALQGEWARPQTFGHLDTLLAPFVRQDGLDYSGVRRLVRQFVLALNACLLGNEGEPSCVLALDGNMPKHLGQSSVVVPGRCCTRRYGEYLEEAAMLNQALFEVMLAGDDLGQPFASPLLAPDLGPGFSWESSLGQSILHLADTGCCLHVRMRDHESDRRNHHDMLATSYDFPGGRDDVPGAIGVVSLNLPKLAFLAGRESDFLDLIGEYAEYAKQALEFKRKCILDAMGNGMFPYSSHYLANTLRDHCSLLALVGGHEACVHLLGTGIASSQGCALMHKVLRRLTRIVTDFSQKTTTPYALTTVVDNEACHRLAGIDEALYAEIVCSKNGSSYYTNSLCLPKGHGLSWDEAIKHQTGLARLFPGYPVVEIVLGDRNNSEKLPALFHAMTGCSGGVYIRPS